MFSQCALTRAVDVERLRGDDAVAAGVLREPPLDVQDHPVDSQQAPTRVVAGHDLLPPPVPHALCQRPPLGRAELLQRTQA